ncbi:hypothetical protein [Okeania sp. SIO2C2]|nr:hypothetical protein [Okeania sp. SIO2C2]
MRSQESGFRSQEGRRRKKKEKSCALPNNNRTYADTLYIAVETIVQ